MNPERCRVLGTTLGCLLAVGLLATSGCNRDRGAPKVVVTTTMIGDLVQRVGGGKVAYEVLMGPGVDPHLYEPKPSDTEKLLKAPLILYNGLHLEGKMAELLEHNSKAKAVTRNVPKERLLIDDGQPDPHVWFDVTLWIHALKTVEEELTALDPANAETFRQNAAAYRGELQAFDKRLRDNLAQLPTEQRVMITAHDAFRYFGRAYSVEVHGLQGISTIGEAGIRRIDELTDLIVTRKIKAIFVETSVPDDGIDKLIERCGKRGHKVVKAPGKLYSDAMGEPGSPGGTYPGMIEHNVRVVVEALK